MKAISKPLLRSIIVCLLTCMVTGAIIITPLSAQTQDEKGFVTARSDPSSSFVQGTCWALLVGIADYPQVEGFEIQPLKSPVKDVNNLAAFLKSPRSGGCFDDEHVFTLTDEEATRLNILATLNDIARRAAPEDMVIFYFSGHGTYHSEHKMTYLIPYDHHLDRWDLETTCINFYNLSRKLNAMEAKKVVTILDACRSGGIKEEGSRATPRSELNKLYMEAFAEAEGRPLLLSSGEKQDSWEDEKGGIFTQFLLKGLGGEADKSVKGNNDGIVTFEELFHYLQKTVPEYTKKYFPRVQKPTRRYAPGEVEGDIPLAINWDAHDEFRQELKDQLDERSQAIFLASRKGLDETLKEFSLKVAKSAHDKALTSEELTDQEELLLTEMDLLQSGKITVDDYIQRARVIYNMGPVPLATRVEQVLEHKPVASPDREEAPPDKEEALPDKSEISYDTQKKSRLRAPMRRLTAGLKAGLCISRFRGNYWDDLEPKIGFCGGGFITGNINSILAIQPEILFVMKGAEEPDDYEVELNYLEIPVLIKLSMPGGIVAPKLFLGPAFAMKLISNEVYEDGYWVEIDYLTDIDFGLVIGAGIDLDTGYGKIVIEARYTLGLVTIKDEEGYDIENDVISFMAGYSF